VTVGQDRGDLINRCDGLVEHTGVGVPGKCREQLGDLVESPLYRNAARRHRFIVFELRPFKILTLERLLKYGTQRVGQVAVKAKSASCNSTALSEAAELRAIIIPCRSDSRYIRASWTRPK